MLRAGFGRSAVPYMLTMTLKPPKNMRLGSKGGFFMCIIFAMRGSLITFSFTASRCLRDLYTIHENQTVSLGLSLTLRGNDVTLPRLTSSATHSRYSTAPCSR